MIKILLWLVFGSSIAQLEHRDFRKRAEAQEYLQEWVWVAWPLFDYQGSAEQQLRLGLIRVPNILGIQRYIVLSNMPSKELAKHIDKYPQGWSEILNELDARYFDFNQPFIMAVPTSIVIDYIRKDYAASK